MAYQNSMAHWSSEKCFPEETLKFIGQLMGKDGLENLTLTRHAEGTKTSRKQRVTCITNLCTWITEHRDRKVIKINIPKRYKC